MFNEELTCLFCLEQSTAENIVIQFSFHKNIQEMPCTCRFNIHVECWMIYFLKKGCYECPICHAKLGEPSPRIVQNIIFETNSDIYTIAVPVDTSQTIHIEIPTSNREDGCNARNLVTCSVCSLLFLGVLTFAFTQAS